MDILILNAKIIDGSGKTAYQGRVGIDGGKICLENLPETAEQVIDAAGLTLAPGFIDCHSHGDRILGLEFGDLCKLNHGVTTQLAGQCGNSQVPESEAYRQARDGAGTSWKRCWSSYADHVDTLPMALNTALFVGFNTIRIAVMGYTDRKPTADEVRAMQDLLIDAMEHGALGMSSGLAYIPGTYTDTDDVVEIAKVMAKYGGIYTTHMRNESFDLVNSVKEAVEIGRKAGVAVNISHFKAMGRSNWGSVGEAIAVIEEARAEGLQVTVDQYPYNCSMTQLYPCMPPWYFTEGVGKVVELLKDPAVREKIRREMEDPATPYENLYLNAGGFGGITACGAPATPEAEGKTIEELAALWGKEPFDAFFDLLIANRGIVPAVYHSIGDEDILKIIQLPYAMVGSDGVVRSATEKVHPRGWGAMVRAINLFTKEHPVLSLEALIRKMTGLPADVYRLEGKGYIQEGYDADLVLFDYDRLEDRSTYQDPTALAGGVKAVFVNGKIVYQDGAMTGERPGKLIRRRR